MLKVLDGLDGTQYSANKHADHERFIDSVSTHYVVKTAKKYIVILYFQGELLVRPTVTHAPDNSPLRPIAHAEYEACHEGSEVTILV